MVIVLFVCLGNICRSSAAEGILRHFAVQRGISELLQIDSAGTSGEHDGQEPDPRMIAQGKKRGYVFDSKSRKFAGEDFTRFDYIIVMDRSIEKYVRKMDVEGKFQDKITSMVDYGEGDWGGFVLDPWYGGAKEFEYVLDALEDCCEGMLDHIVKINF